MSEVFASLEASGIVPVIVLADGADAARLGEALARGGLPSAEVTLRTPSALDAIRALAKLPGFLVGAGTVVEPAQVELAVEAGARYVVSPGFSKRVSRECSVLGVPLIPGVVTATEIQMAVEAGHSVVKFFPAAAAGGAAMVRALAAPFPHVRFIPTGGVDASSLPEYLRLSSVLAVGGTWLAPRELVAAGEFDEVTRRTVDALAAVREYR